MTRDQAIRLVISAARKVAETYRETYATDGQYQRVLADRVLRLRRAIRDLDGAENEESLDARGKG